jgi:hypothetical protein
MKNTKKSTRTPSQGKARPFTLGRVQFAKISAVEGVALSDEMLREFEQFERNKVSAEDRRRAIVRGYAKPTA